MYFDEDGVEHEQKASFVVLAANGTGTPRLPLLSAHSGAPHGLANSSGLVGKRLMLHPDGEVTGIYDEPMDSWLGPAGQSIYSLEFYETDVSRGFVGGAKWQVMPTRGPLRALSLHDRVPFEEQWGPAIYDRVRDTLDRSLQWAINSQDMPEESNAVELDDTLKDSHGIPAPRVRYRISENTLRLIEFNLGRAEEAHLAAGALSTVRTDLWPSQPGHLLETAKMGTDPATPVVDGWGIARQRRAEPRHRRRQHDADVRRRESHRDHRRDGTPYRGTTCRQCALAGDGVVTGLFDAHRELLLRVADVLIPPNGMMPSLRNADPTGEWVERACLVRAEALADLTDALDGLAGRDDLTRALRELHADARATFDVVANIASGAHYSSPKFASCSAIRARCETRRRWTWPATNCPTRSSKAP